MPSQFAYLQLYSRWSGFGGLPEVDALVRRLWEISSQEGKAVAAALTDTFSLAAYPEFAQRLAENGVRPLAGAEIILTIAEIPYSLLLYATSETGYANLCRIITNGWHKAGNKPLLASIDINTLGLFSEDLIAISPYFGGPVTAATKATDAKYRAKMLHGIFGSDNFYLGVPLQVGDKTTKATGDLLNLVSLEDEAKPGEGEKPGKQANPLLKLSRDLKIGLVATGEARYLHPEDSRNYQNLRNRLQRALSEQLPHSVIQQQQLNKHDWFYSFNRPAPSFHLRPPAELLKLYNEVEWPNALLNNIKIAQRCANWQFTASPSLDWLRQRCLESLSELYPAEDQPVLRLRLESELADITELNLADALRAAILLTEFASKPNQLTIPRHLGGSLVAYLTGLSGQAVAATAEAFNFELYRGGRLINIEVGSAYREQLVALPDIQQAATALAYAPALASADPDLLPTLHPRQTIIRLDSEIALNLPIQAVQANGTATISYGAQIGDYLPPGYAKIEIVETGGVTRLNLALAAAASVAAEIANPTEATEIPALPNTPAANYRETSSSFERALTLTRLDWFKTYQPAAFYAAALTLAAGNREQTARLVELVRLSGLKLRQPDISKSKLAYTLEDSETIRCGLVALLSRERINQLETAQLEVYNSLEEFLEVADFTSGELEKLAWAGAFDKFGKREEFAAGAELLENSSRALREWHKEKKATENNPFRFLPIKAAPTSGQLDLFASLPETPALKTAPEKPRLPVLPETAPLNRLERWRKAHQALGFFTTDHPLWALTLAAATTTDVSRNDPVPLDRALEVAQAGNGLIVAGLLTGVRHIPVALAGEGQGEELTVLQLEDFSGKLELLLPKDTPSEGITPEEGQVIAAQVRPVKTARRLALVALALAAYPPATNRPLFPQPETTPTDLELEELEEDLPPPDEPPFEDVPPPDMPPPETTLFGDFQPAPKPEPATLAPGQPLPASGKGGSKNKGKPVPVRTRRVVHLTLPYEDDQDKEIEVMNGLKNTLVRFSGEDSVILYLQQADGKYEKLEPQGIGVSYNPEFLAAVMHWVGTDGIRLEERTY